MSFVRENWRHKLVANRYHVDDPRRELIHDILKQVGGAAEYYGPGGGR